MIGQSEELAWEMFNIYRYAEKDIYYITPAMQIGHLHVDKGLAGFGYTPINIEKSQADDWKALLERWKKDNE